MKLFSKPKPRLTAVLLALIIVVGGIPFVVGSHVNDMLSPWREVDDEPTGNSLLDDALATAANTLDSTLEHERIPRRDEPQVPATFFHDIFDPEDQIGGWGDWKPDARITVPNLREFGGWTEEERWHLDASAAGQEVQVPWVTPAGNQDLQTQTYDIDQGYRFGDETGYPVPELTEGGDVPLNFNILVSPLVSLQSLPVQLPDERAEVPGSGSVDQALNADGDGTVDLTQQASGARSSMDGHLDHQDRIILYMDHMYHLAQAEGNRNGDRAGVFLLDANGNVLHNNYLQPLRDQSATHPVGSFSGSFTGAQLEFREEAFDLSPWAGQDVHIVFEVGSEGLDGDTPEEHFGNTNRFQANADFFGWAISNIRVEGPAHMHNVRLDRVTHPSVRDPSGGLFAPTGTEPLQVLLLNRGRVTEDVVVRMDVDGIDIGECADEVLVNGLEPGASVVVDFVQDRSAPKAEQIGCLDIGDDDGFKARFEAEILAREGDEGDEGDVVPREDLYTRDNELVVDVTGQGPDIRLDGRMVADPPLGATNTPIKLDLPVANRGASDADVDLSLRIDRRHPSASDFDEIDVHLDSSLVRFNDDSDADQPLYVPGRGHASAAWGFSVLEAGLYRVTVEATGAGSREFFSATVVVGALVAPEFSYDTRFDGTEFDDDDTKIRGGWEPESLIHTTPPCAPESGRGACLPAEQAVVWELDSEKRLTGTGDQQHPVALRGEFDVENLEQGPSEVTDLEIRFLHYAADIRCPTRTFGSFRPCDVPFSTSSHASAPSAPESRLSVRIMEGAAQTTRVTPSAPVVTDIGSTEIQHVGGSHYRNAFYNGQWILETHRVSVNALLGVDGVPMGRLADLALEFVLMSSYSYNANRGDALCPSTAVTDISCPLWRVAEASVTGLEADGTPTDPLVHWAGLRSETPVGTWYSYATSPEGGGQETLYPNCLDDEANSEALERNQGRCPVWKQIPVLEIEAASPAAPAWGLQEGIDAWTNALPQAGGHYEYEESQGDVTDVLLSPVFRVPDGDAPAVSFDHRFQLHAYNEASGELATERERSPSFADTGMIMVRFFDPEGSEPQTPFLPVYLENGRFSRNDCVHYYGQQHPDNGLGCPEALLERSSARETFDLSNFPLLDYRDPQASLLDNPVIAGSQGGSTGYGYKEDNDGNLVPSETGDVGNAFTRADLRRCTAEGLPLGRGASIPVDAKPCAAQFAFRLEVPDPVATGSDSIESDKATTRLSELKGDGYAEGWFIDSFRIVKDDLTDFDLTLVDAKIDTAYDWEAVGLGPGTEAVATLEVQNNGFFTVDKALFHVTVQDPLFPDEDHTWRFEQPSDAEFVLAEGESATVNVTFDLPSLDGNYRIAFGVDLLGDLIADESIPLTDMEPGNDCRYLLLEDGQRSTAVGRSDSGCNLEGTQSVPVFRNPELSMGLSITPEAGRAGEEFPREVNLRIDNNGNSIVEDATLDIVIVRAAEDAVPEVHQWIVSESPLPGHTKSWTGLPLLDRQGDGSAALARIVLEEDGTYFATAFLRPSQADRLDGHDWEVLRQIRLDAFDTIYADSFGSQRVEPDHPSMLSGEEMVPRDGNWTNVGAQVPDEDGDLQDARVWRFGDSETGQYPNGADASLELPGIDLSSARRAILSISHNYELEQGYDGARVEASIDGDDWLPLHPRGGYPGIVGAQNPLNGQNDPTDPAHAFTGDSFSRNPLTDGWVIDEFDLANLPDFTTPVLVEQFNQEGFDGGPHIGSPKVQRPSDGSITYHQDWRRPSTECTGQLENCWSRDNLNWQNPAPLQPDGEFFWSGSAGSALSPAAGGFAGGNTWTSPGTEMFLTLSDLPDLQDQTVRLRYSYWKDVAGQLTIEPDFVPPSLIPTHGAGTSGGWVDGTVPIPTAAFDEAAEFQLRILYEDTLCTRPGPWRNTNCMLQVDHHNRGAAIDNVALEVLSQQGGKAIVDQSVVLLDNGQAGEGVALGGALIATAGANNRVRNLPVDGSNGFCTRESPNNFGSILCEQVDGDWKVVETWGWQPRDRIPPSPEAWGVDEQRTRRGEEGLVWRFGTEFDPIDQPGHTTYPDNAHERLITPRVDLQGVAGESAFLSYWERYDLMRHDLLHPPGTSLPNNALDRIEARCGEVICYDERSVYVQVVEPTPEGGERLSEWQKLAGVELVYRDAQADPEHGRFVFDDYRVTRSDPRGEGCTDDVPAWCPVEVDISDYIGQKVRFAFDIKTNRLDLEPGTTDDDHMYGLSIFQTFGYANHASRADPPQVMTGGRGSNAWGDVFGWSWMIDEVGVKADSLVGQPLQLRLRAATDDSIQEGEWMVENVQLVGLTYESNVAVLPNQTIRDRSLAAQETIEMSGVVRNLGPGPQRNIYLALSSKANEDEADLPEVRFLLDGDGEPEETVGGRVGPIFLGSAGATSSGELLDRVPYKLQVELPEVDSDTIYSFRLEVQDEDGAVLDDKNLGDHLREFQVNIKDDDNYVASDLHVDRPTLETVKETARFSLPIDNTGSMRLGGQIWTNVTRLADGFGAPVEEDPTLLAGVTVDEVMAGAQGAVEWEWTPGEDFEAGFYRVEATVEPSSPHGSQTRYAHVLVGGLPIYYVEDFAQNPFTDSQWTRSGPACNAQQTDCWRTSTVFQEFGNQSLFIGDDASPGYPDHDAAQATTPGIDLSFLARDPADKESSIVTGQSPFKPYLSARYHPTLAGNDDVTVEARSGDSDEYEALRTGDPLSGRSNDMQVASFPLFEENNNVLGTGERLLKDDTSSFRFDTGTWGGGDGFGFALDLLTISSYDVEVDPPRHDIDLRLGSDKVFYFKVENTGAANDTYSVAIDSEGTADIFQSPVTTVEVLTPQITLDPGGSSLAEVRVKIPFQRMPDKFSGTEIEVSVTSGVDPNRVATGVIHVEDFIEADLADLVTDLRRPRGETGPVVEGEQATFIASITNHGDRASRETDLVVFACPTHRFDEEGKKVREISLSECSKEGLAVEIGAVPLASLTPSKDADADSSDHVSTRTFSWVPPLGSRGEYQVVAVADPRQVVVQFDRSSSTDSLDLEVAPIERPDVVVTDLRVTDASGNEVRQASAGETLHIEGTVENLGDAPAPNVKARIVNQFNLRDERIGDLNPGASRTLDAQWVAQPGNWVILFEGTTSAVEIDSSNNAKRWSLAVRSGTLQAHWDPGVVHVDPGATMDAVLRVDNHRDNPADLMVSVSADQFSLRGVPGSMTLARGASTEAEVVVSASPFAHAGHHSIDVEFVQRDTGAVLASSSLEVHVGAERDVRVAVDPLHSPPGTASLPLTFTNGGDAVEAFTVRLDGPEDWIATVLQPSIRLEAGASREVQALLEIPPGTPAGSYELMLDAEVLQEMVTVDVVKQPVWRSDVKSVHSLSDHVEVLVSVENVGNARAAPPFLAEEAYSVDPTPRPHEPGEVRTYHLRIQTTDGVASVALPGHGAVPVELRPERPDVEAMRLDVQNAGTIASGDRVSMRFAVRNADDDAQHALPVRLWADGVLVGEERLDLASGESRDIDFGWTVAKSGPRLVTATVGSGDDAVARTIVLNVGDASAKGIPGPPLVLLVGLMAVAVALRRRRDA